MVQGAMRLSSADRTSTRQKVLETSLALFNERGSANVTTAEIAEAAGIAEGNLHYYFHRKADLVIALYEAFEAEIVRVNAREFSDDGPLEDYAEYQRDWFRLMWTHRWFYRDAVALLAVAPELEPRVRAGTARAQQVVRTVFDRMVGRGVLRATPAQVERLLANVWIVSTYWIDYLRPSAGSAALREADLDWGYAQVLALYAPFLTAKGRALARTGMARRRPRQVG
jgi:AcrR family transcriptional regulator